MKFAFALSGKLTWTSFRICSDNLFCLVTVSFKLLVVRPLVAHKVSESCIASKTLDFKFNTVYSFQTFVSTVAQMSYRRFETQAENSRLCGEICDELNSFQKFDFYTFDIGV
jgi:hypothetical protein